MTNECSRGIGLVRWSTVVTLLRFATSLYCNETICIQNACTSLNQKKGYSGWIIVRVIGPKLLRIELRDNLGMLVNTVPTMFAPHERS